MVIIYKNVKDVIARRLSNSRTAPFVLCVHEYIQIARGPIGLTETFKVYLH